MTEETLKKFLNFVSPHVLFLQAQSQMLKCLKSQEQFKNKSIIKGALLVKVQKTKTHLTIITGNYHITTMVFAIRYFLQYQYFCTSSTPCTAHSTP